ncbi:MAG: hypothetical protein V3R81_14050 [Gammaproteobacteria bacterium]
MSTAGAVPELTDRITTPIFGDAVSATSDAAGYPAGSTSITLAAAGTGAIKVTDTVLITGQPYRVDVGIADVSLGGALELKEPGLMTAISAIETGVTIKASPTYQIVNVKPFKPGPVVMFYLVHAET